jgi:hypothetical protein
MIKIDYAKFNDLIQEGILKHNKNLFVGFALIKGKGINDTDGIEASIDLMVERMAYNVIVNIQKEFKDNLIVLEDGEEIMKEDDK